MRRFVFIAIVAFSISAPLLALAEERALLKQDSELAFTLHESTAENGTHITLAVQLPPDTSVATLVLEHPVRVVIDLPPFKTMKNKVLSVDKSAAVSALRIGAHSDKLRLVLDMRGKKAPEIRVNQTERGTEIDVFLQNAAAKPTPPVVATVQIILPDSTAAATPEPQATHSPTAEGSATEVPATQTAQATATDTPASATATPSATATSSPTNTVEPTPSTTPTAALPTVTPTPSPVPSTVLPTVAASTGPRLLEFGFEYSSPEHVPFIRISLSNRSEFKLTKIDERLYKLSIPGAQLASLALKLPQFPPHDFAGFTFLQAEQQGESVEVKIGVERGTRINALPQANDILVRTLIQ